MTKKELNQAFSKIQPREDLINDTIIKAREQKVRGSRRSSLPTFSQGMRLASAVCAFALVFCFGFTVAKQSAGTPAERTLADLAVVASHTDTIPAATMATECTDGYILINGKISGLSFISLTEDDISNNALYRCKTIINAVGLVEKSDELAVDLHQTSENFEAEIVFYDEVTMNNFFNQSTQEMLLCLAPDTNGQWDIVAFDIFEK